MAIRGYLRTVLLTAAPLWGALGALVAGAILISSFGVSPVKAYAALLDGALGSLSSIAVTLNKATPILLAALGVAFAFRCGAFNIGAEGQIYLGGLGAAVVGLNFAGFPRVLHLPLALFAGFIAGALWAGVAGVLKVKRNVNEFLSTLLMTYVAVLGVGFLVQGPLRDPTYFYPQTRPLLPSALLPLMPVARLHGGVLIGLLGALVCYFILWKTPLGLEVRAVGLNPRAARQAGINVSKRILQAMLISGGFAGLAGASEILGVQGKLVDSFSPGYGWTAIAASILGQNHPLVIVPTALFFAALQAGASQMQRAVGLPVTVVQILVGVVVIFVLASTVLQYLFKPKEVTVKADAGASS